MYVTLTEVTGGVADVTYQPPQAKGLLIDWDDIAADPAYRDLNSHQTSEFIALLKQLPDEIGLRVQAQFQRVTGVDVGVKYRRPAARSGA